MRSLLTFIFIFLSSFLFYNFAFAQTDGMVPEMSIAGYAVPLLLTIIMGLIYKFIPAFSDRYKAMITIVVAIVLAVVSMYYEPPADGIVFASWVETIIGGILIGCQAIGLYEGARTFYRPRE